MIRPLDVILVGAMITSAIWTFQIKHEAEIASEKVAALQKSIRLEKDRINLLRADWALLRQPGRLQKLAEKYADELKLQNLEPEQFVQLDELPDFSPPPVLDDPIGDLASDGASDGTSDAANDGIDNQTTGSIVRPAE